MTSPEYEKYEFEQWWKTFFQKPHLFFEVYLGIFILEYEKYKCEQWGKNYFQKPHLFFEVYLGLFLRNPY